MPSTTHRGELCSGDSALRWIAGALALAGSLAPLPAAAAGPLLLSRTGPARLELPSGARVELPLPAGAEIAAVAGLGESWIAAGTQPRGNPADGRRELLLLAGQGAAGHPRTLPRPPGDARLRGGPVPLVAGGRLAALAWLEGEDGRSLAVRFARWNGSRWGTPKTVSPPGPGTQTALAAARLGDGSWLLAWSAFDGEDDEVVWSRGTAEGWSRPRRVAADNAVPDIAPALSPSGSGALLAWSRYDGEDYRVVVARFRDGRWAAPRPVGPAGSVFPTFEGTPGPAGARLLFRVAQPRAWEVLELDAADRPRRRAMVAAPAAERVPERPVVAGAGPEGARLRWPLAGRPPVAAAWEPVP